MGNPLIDDLKLTPHERAEKKVKAERGDVVNSLNAIERTIKGIKEKKDKIAKTEDKKRKKEYQKQLRSSEKYLDDLFVTLKLEMIEAVHAELHLEELGPKEEKDGPNEEAETTE